MHAITAAKIAPHDHKPSSLVVRHIVFHEKKDIFLLSLWLDNLPKFLSLSPDFITTPYIFPTTGMSSSPLMAVHPRPDISSVASFNQDLEDREDKEEITPHAKEEPTDCDTPSTKPLVSTAAILLSLAADVGCVLVCIALFVFAMLAYCADGHTLGSYERKLINAARIITTAFPYTFAFVLGRCIQNFLNWRLEKGVDVLTIAYLGRSSTLTGTYVAPLRLRVIHWLPLLLALLWAFSPIGSQAALRILSAQQDTIVTELQSPVQYGYPVSITKTIGSDGMPAQDAASSIVIASMLSITVTGPKPQDIWGNIKIPFLNTSVPPPRGNDWTQVDLESNTTQFSSLLGMPYIKVQDIGNTTFLMQSWYWELQDPKMTWSSERLQINYLNESSANLTSKLSAPSNYTFSTGTNSMWTIGLPIDWPKFEGSTKPNLSASIIFAEWDFNSDGKTIDVTKFEATLLQRPVEVNVSCTTASCAATAIRSSRFPTGYSAASDCTLLRLYMMDNLKSAFPLTYAAANNGAPSLGIFEQYLQDGSRNAFTSLTDRPVKSSAFLHELREQDVALRLMQVLNSYFTASSFLGSIVGEYKTADFGFVGFNGTRNATGTASNHKNIVRCDRNWHAILSIATSVLFCAAVFSTFITTLRIAPDSSDFISALTRSDGSARLETGSSLDEDARVRLLKDMRLRVGETSSDDYVGLVVIGRAENTSALKRESLYR
ncbi:hypothetical protein EG328_007139 [Venturia inaequalis]|uniref:Transmembrane protein n=2 Tax=Venturia inaequalis TaxID=5025 RepID=A0A8H3UG36_VENIN|nr:hypothetical protein EG328_007139 [Venturia inaequalis]